jgi:hypothetical protein
MLRLAYFLLLLVAANFTGFGQTGQKSNPVLFSEFFAGYSGGSGGGLSAGVALNFQSKRSLFTARYLGTVKINSMLPLLLIFPIFFAEPFSGLEETSLLYGRRFVDDGSAFSFSAGLSYNRFTVYGKDSNNTRVASTTYYAGVPFEANINWFKANKKRLRVLFMPVGKPSSFGGSFGVKLFGNISRNSFVGLGLVFGIGFHKKY